MHMINLWAYQPYTSIYSYSCMYINIHYITYYMYIKPHIYIHKHIHSLVHGCYHNIHWFAHLKKHWNVPHIQHTHRYIYVCISIYKMDTYLPSNRSTYEHAHMHEYIFPSKNKTLLPMYTYTDSYIIKYTMQSSHLQWIRKHIQTQKVSSTQEY